MTDYKFGFPTDENKWIERIKSVPHEVDMQQFLFELRRLSRLTNEVREEQKQGHPGGYQNVIPMPGDMAKKFGIMGLRQLWDGLEKPRAEPEPVQVQDDAVPVGTVSMSINGEIVRIRFYSDHTAFVFEDGYLGSGGGEIILTHEQVAQMMAFAEERVTWKSSPSRTEPALCVYRGDGRAFTIDRIRWEGEDGIEVYNRFCLTAVERRKLFADIRACQKKVRKFNEKMAI